MIYRVGDNAKIEKHKQVLGLTGDVYWIDHKIESLESHKILIPTSVATTIEEAEAERIAYEAEQEALRAQQAQQNVESTQGE